VKTDGLTNRERIEMTHEVAECAACHKLIDPVGWSLEHFDAVGGWQDKDGAKPVNAAGTIVGTFDADGAVNGLPALASKLAASEQVVECLAANWMRYGLGRSLQPTDGCEVASLTEQVLATPNWSAKKLVGALATSASFRSLVLEAP
jgi:hypothetical protein